MSFVGRDQDGSKIEVTTKLEHNKGFDISRSFGLNEKNNKINKT